MPLKLDPLIRGFDLVLHIVSHLMVVGVMIVGALVFHHLLLQYGDPKLYDMVPWRYVLDTMDVALVVALVVFGTVSFVAVLRAKEHNQ